MRKRLVRKPGFSLVELVIVVVIIGVIAAIAVPRISRGAKGAREAALRGSLRTLRDAIDMYAAEHGGEFAGADGVAQTWIDQLTKRTDVAGDVGATVGVHIYGPYLRDIPPIPVGPNVGVNGVDVTSDGTFGVNETKTGGTIGWMCNQDTGEIIANTDDLDDSGVRYDTY